MRELLEALDALLGADARAWLDRALAGSEDVRVLLPQLPRNVGRTPLPAGRERVCDGDVDLGAWRACDAAAALLLRRTGEPPAPELVLDLFAHGDLQERAMVLRTRTVLPVDAATLALLGEVQRTNTQDHVEALVLDSDLVARAADAGFARDDFNRLILKIAFLGLPLARMFGTERHANAELSRMLRDLATEREAAGRGVWPDTARLMGRAPADGTVARLLGGLEHGDDALRLAAVEGLAALNRPELRPFLEERLPREARPAIRVAIDTILRS